MQFEEWCSQEGFIEKAEKCAKEFINQMKLLDIKMFLNIFENFNMENVQYQFHSASYVINYNKQKEKNYIHIFQILKVKRWNCMKLFLDELRLKKTRQ